MIRACRGVLDRMAEMKGTVVELKVQFYQIRHVSIHELLTFDSLETLKSMKALSTGCE